MQLLYVTLLKINFPQNLSNLMKHAWCSAAAAAEPAHRHPPGSGTRCGGAPGAVCPLCWPHPALGHSTSAQPPLPQAQQPSCTGYRSPPRHKLRIPPLRGLGIPHLCEQKSSFSRESASPLSVCSAPPVFGSSASSSPEAKHSPSPGAKRSPSPGNQHPTLQRDSTLLCSSQGVRHPLTRAGCSHRERCPLRSGTRLLPRHRAARPSPGRGILRRGKPPPRHRTAHPAAPGTASLPRPRAARSPPRPRSSPAAAAGPYRSG